MLVRSISPSGLHRCIYLGGRTSVLITVLRCTSTSYHRHAQYNHKIIAIAILQNIQGCYFVFLIISRSFPQCHLVSWQHLMMLRFPVNTFFAARSCIADRCYISTTSRAPAFVTLGHSSFVIVSIYSSRDYLLRPYLFSLLKICCIRKFKYLFTSSLVTYIKRHIYRKRVLQKTFFWFLNSAKPHGVSISDGQQTPPTPTWGFYVIVVVGALANNEFLFIT